MGAVRRWAKPTDRGDRVRSVAVHDVVDFRAHPYPGDVSVADGGIPVNRCFDGPAGRRIRGVAADYSVDGWVFVIPGHGEHWRPSQDCLDGRQRCRRAAPEAIGARLYAGGGAAQHVDFQYRIGVDAHARGVSSSGFLLEPFAARTPLTARVGMVLQHRWFGYTDRDAP